MTGDKEIAAIEAVLKPGAVDTTLFSAEFLKAVPPAQLQAVFDKLTTDAGQVMEVAPVSGMDYVARTATHDVPIQIVLDHHGKIVGLMLRPAIARDLSVELMVADMRDIAPEFGLLVTRDGEDYLAHEHDMALAVGSAFKIGVLKALRDAVDAGNRRWENVAVLAETDISLPSGTLQTWPVGSPLTLHTLASMMISISDNTATDALMHVLGRDAVERVLGIAPVLTTRELFTLKADERQRARYLAADLEGKRAVLEELADAPLPAVGDVMTPYEAGLEWMLSARTLCGLVAAVGDLDVMAINPGIADKATWKRVAFKGGSEIGVLNFTTLVTADTGHQYCVAATWNAPESIDQTKAAAAYANLLGWLARGEERAPRRERSRG